MTDEDWPHSRFSEYLARFWHRFRQWIDVPAIIGIALIFAFAIWFVRHYAVEVS